MLFSFRSADASKFPVFLNVQTVEMAFDEKGIKRLMEQGLAHYDEAENAIVFTEFEKPRVQVAGSASEWPDIIGCEIFTENPIVVSDRVVAAFQQAGVTGCSTKPVEVVKKPSRKLDVRTAPEYYFLEVSGRIDMPVPSCINADDVAPDLADTLTSKWDQTDLFLDPPSPVGRWALFCSEKVYELAQAEKWTNCGFQPLHYFAPYHKRYLKHESEAPLSTLVKRYTRQLK